MHQPDLYSAASELGRLQTNDLLDEFGEDVRRMSGRCLDIGTGPGNVILNILLPKLNPKATVVGSDLSESMVNYAKKNYESDRVSFMQLDIQTPNLPNDLIGQFDNVTSSYCLHWCHNLPKAFENIVNLLRPGGSAFFTFLDEYPTFAATELLARMHRYQPYMQDIKRFIPYLQYEKRPRESLKRLLKDVGFQVHHCSSREVTAVYNTRKDLSGFLLTINPYTERIPADMLADFEEDLVREVMKHTFVSRQNNTNEYNILVRYRLFVVYLTKPLANSGDSPAI